MANRPAQLAFGKGLPIGLSVGVLFGALWAMTTQNLIFVMFGIAMGVGMAPLFGQMLLKASRTPGHDETDGKDGG